MIELGVYILYLLRTFLNHYVGRAGSETQKTLGVILRMLNGTWEVVCIHGQYFFFNTMT